MQYGDILIAKYLFDCWKFNFNGVACILSGAPTTRGWGSIATHDITLVFCQWKKSGPRAPGSLFNALSVDFSPSLNILTPCIYNQTHHIPQELPHIPSTLLSQACCTEAPQCLQLGSLQPQPQAQPNPRLHRHGHLLGGNPRPTKFIMWGLSFATASFSTWNPVLVSRGSRQLLLYN